MQVGDDIASLECCKDAAILDRIRGLEVCRSGKTSSWMIPLCPHQSLIHICPGGITSLCDVRRPSLVSLRNVFYIWSRDEWTSAYRSVPGAGKPSQRGLGHTQVEQVRAPHHNSPLERKKRQLQTQDLLPTSSFDRALCSLSLAILTPHTFIHLIQEYTGMSHLFRLVLLILCNLLRGGISFQESQGQPSLPILRQQEFALGEVLTAKIAAICHPHLGCQPHLGAALCVLHCSPPAGHYYSSLLWWRVLQLAIWKSTRGVVTRTTAKF